jgi:ferredoxin-NADP reductase
LTGYDHPVTELTLLARDVVQATPRTRIISIDLGIQSFNFHAGQAVFAGLAEGSVRRPYSIACSPGQMRRSNAIELLVQIDDHAAPDPHLERVARGTQIRVEGPFGAFGLVYPIPERRLLMIAGGTGIAPLRSMLWDTRERQPDLDISVIYSARSAQEFAYADELNQLARERAIKLWLTVTRHSNAPWVGLRGRVNEPLIAEALEARETRCVICGPPSLVADATAMLQSHGIARDSILTETYDAS